MKKFFLFSLILLSNLNLTNAQVIEWENKVYTSSGRPQNISVDTHGNTYISGYFYYTIQFGTYLLTSDEYSNAFLVKYDPAGKCVWAKKAVVNSAYGLGIDGKSNCYISGDYTSTAKFDTTKLLNTGYSDIYISKYDSNGNFIWAKKAGGSSDEYSYKMAVEENGNFYITGHFMGTAYFGNKQLTCNGTWNPYVAKYDSNGNCLWAKQGITQRGEGLAISADGAGNCYLTGYFQNSVQFGSVQLTGIADDDVFICKYDVNGNCIWAKKAGGTRAERGLGVTADKNGNSFLTGIFKETAAFGNFQLTSNGDADIFIAKYDNTGTCLWAKNVGGTSYDEGLAVFADADGNSYFTGSFQDTVRFGQIQYVSRGYDIFILKIDKDGNYIWAKQLGSYGSDAGTGICVDKNNIYLTGMYGQYIYGTKITEAAIDITSPHGNEIWQSNTSHNITWNTKVDGNVKIELSTNNGSSWITISSGVQASLGNYNFTVPPINSSNCKIKISSVNYPNVLAESTTSFSLTTSSIPYIFITSPDTSVIWKSGTFQNINWSASGTVLFVKMEYTSDNGSNWNLIADSVSAPLSSYNWRIPYSPSTNCRVRISDTQNPILNDVSNALFTIAGIMVTSPNGNENWKAGTNQNITWNSTGVSSVNIYYSSDNGNNWNVVATNLNASDGSRNWTVPSLTSTTCLIRIQETSNASFFDVTNNTFTIWQPITSSKTPALGQITESFGLTNISLSAFVVVTGSVTVSYYYLEAPQTGSLPADIKAVSNYYWVITSPTLSYIDGIIRVPLSSLQGVLDSSKIVWLKRSNPGEIWTNIGGNISNGNLESTIPFNSFSEFAIGTKNSVVPVELTLFKATGCNTSINMEWITATEVNNSGFVIERRQQMNYWQKIGNLPGHGTTTDQNHYFFIDKNVQGNTKYYYRLKQMDLDGSFKYSNELEVDFEGTPVTYNLEQNYPNPFNPRTIIKYSVPDEVIVNIKIYDLLGREIKTLVNEQKAPGNYLLEFNGDSYSSGLYMYVIKAGSYIQVKKMMLLK